MRPRLERDTFGRHAKNVSRHTGLAARDATKTKKLLEMRGFGGHSGLAARDAKASCLEPYENEIVT